MLWLQVCLPCPPPRFCDAVWDSLAAMASLAFATSDCRTQCTASERQQSMCYKQWQRSLALSGRASILCHRYVRSHHGLLVVVLRRRWLLQACHLLLAARAPFMQVLDLVHSENYLHRMTVLSAIGALAPLVNKDVVHNSMLPMVVACCKVGWLAGITSPPVLLLPRSRAATIHSGAVAVCFVCLCVVLCLWLAVFFASPACPPVSCLD